MHRHEIFLRTKRSISDCSRSNQMPQTEQITQIAPHVRAYFWVNILYKYHGVIYPLFTVDTPLTYKTTRKKFNRWERTECQKYIRIFWINLFSFIKERFTYIGFVRKCASCWIKTAKTNELFIYFNRWLNKKKPKHTRRVTGEVS